MDNFIFIFAGIMLLICLFGFFNEKVTKLTYEIMLMVLSIVVGALLLLAGVFITHSDVSEVLAKIQLVNIESFLMEGVLCFMLFAGACPMKLGDFKKQARQVTVLSVVATLLGACFYGFMFFGISRMIGLNLSLPVSLMFGSIVAPTDPIAATSILNKFGLPEKTSFLIQGESLFNDGVGVALFVVFSGLATATSSGGFFSIMIKEIVGAVVVGVIITFLCFQMYKRTKSRTLGIFVSLLTVSLAYALCELFGFSGAIASVVCGIIFSYLRDKQCKDEEPEKANSFDSFWETIDVLLNSVLYVMLGLSFVRIIQMERVILLSILAIIANLIARGGSLAISTLVMGEIPDGYSRSNFIKLLTWGGLRGGLCIALAMSTREMIPEETYYIILGCTYAIVFFTTVVQGLTMKAVYKKIDLSVLKHQQ